MVLTFLEVREVREKKVGLEVREKKSWAGSLGENGSLKIYSLAYTGQQHVHRLIL